MSARQSRLALNVVLNDNQHMSLSQTELFESVLALPASVRADLAFELLLSLQPPGEEIASGEFERELHERVEAYRRGEVQSFSLSEARATIHQRLSQERGR